MMKKHYLLVLSIFYVQMTHSLRIDRVILATNNNPMYIQFWPLVAQAWQQLIGVKPTLALIADASVKVDETLGDVYRFDPIPEVPTAQHAQIIRLLLPAYFEDEVCILSDIDMLPISKKYFVGLVAPYPEDSFIIYRHNAYGDNYPQFPMCYIAAKGKMFKEIFGINDVKDINQLIVKFFNLGHGWQTDEKVLYNKLTQWSGYNTNRCVKLGHVDIKRIDRADWKYNIKKLRSGHYTDSHMLRPYNTYKKHIDKLAFDLGIR